MVPDQLYISINLYETATWSTPRGVNISLSTFPEIVHLRVLAVLGLGWVWVKESRKNTPRVLGFVGGIICCIQIDDVQYVPKVLHLYPRKNFLDFLKNPHWSGILHLKSRCSPSKNPPTPFGV